MGVPKNLLIFSKTTQAMVEKAQAMAGKVLNVAHYRIPGRRESVENVRESFKRVVTVDIESNYKGDGGKSAGKKGNNRGKGTGDGRKSAECQNFFAPISKNGPGCPEIGAHITEYWI